MLLSMSSLQSMLASLLLVLGAFKVVDKLLGTFYYQPENMFAKVIFLQNINYDWDF
jgi:hypothetical protein